jgi:hypothetical protein
LRLVSPALPSSNHHICMEGTNATDRCLVKQFKVGLAVIIVEEARLAFVATLRDLLRGIVDTHKAPQNPLFLQNHSLITYKYFEFPLKFAEICGCPGFLWMSHTTFPYHLISPSHISVVLPSSTRRNRICETDLLQHHSRHRLH